jgi:hypothetical protein
MISHYNVKKSSSTIKNFPRFGTNVKTRALVFATIHGQLFPLHHSVISDVPGVASAAQNQFLHSRCVHNRPSRADRQVRTSPCLCVRLFSNSVRHFVTWRTFITPSPFSFIIWRRISMRETYFTHKNRITYKLLHGPKFPMSLPLHIN